MAIEVLAAKQSHPESTLSCSQYDTGRERDAVAINRHKQHVCVFKTCV